MQVSRQDSKALIDALRTVTEYPGEGEERPPVVVGGVVVPDVLDGPAVTELLEMLMVDGRRRSPDDPALDLGRSRSPLQTLREEMDTVVARALAPVELRATARLHTVGGSRPAGWTTSAPEPFPYVAAGPDRDGWWTGVQVLVPVASPTGAGWALHTPTGDVTLHRPGSIALFGPRVMSILTHPGVDEAVTWLVLDARLRFPYRWINPAVRLLAG